MRWTTFEERAKKVSQTSVRVLGDAQEALLHAEDEEEDLAADHLDLLVLRLELADELDKEVVVEERQDEARVLRDRDVVDDLEDEPPALRPSTSGGAPRAAGARRGQRQRRSPRR